MEYEDIITQTRKIIDAYFQNKEFEPEIEGEAGVFVTLKKHEKLRGCIGIIKPSKISKNLKLAAISTLSDSRFEKVTHDEMKDIKIEISLLTPPELVKNPERKIEIGKHGIIIKQGLNSGLLLPQVAIEWKMSIIEFLEAVSEKAGLNKNAWKTSQIWKFSAQIFKET